MEWATNYKLTVFERKRAKHSIVCVWFFSLRYSNISHFNVALYFSLYSNHLFKEAIRVISHDLNYFHHLFRGIFNLLLCVSFFVVIDVVVRNDDDHHSNRNRFTSIYSWRSRNNGYDRKKMMMFLYHQMCNQSIVVRLKPPPEHSTKDLLSVW